jgi:hypothetical protein
MNLEYMPCYLTNIYYKFVTSDVFLDTEGSIILNRACRLTYTIDLIVFLWIIC